MELTKEVLEGINKQFGGSVRYDAAIEHALEAGEGRGLYWRIALLWRAILVGHPFTDGNKRTALAVATLLLKDAGRLSDGMVQERLLDELLVIARDNLEDVPRIERRVRYAAEGC